MGFASGTMENLGITETFWRGKKVLVTGHTGFKGSWLALWLQKLGADVCGFALDPPTQPNLFEQAQVARGMTSIHGDIRDFEQLKQAFTDFEPEFVFHLAAQALVRYSYQFPVETYQTNVIGTLHVLEAIRACPSVHAVVMVTTDKCYENKEWLWAYRENEALGGHDPYSSSKACAELLIASYRQSFFNEAEHAAIASVRAGNVIGGGDWTAGRLIPDILSAFEAQQVVKIRGPNSVRPWQYVLEPLAGYLLLAQRLFEQGSVFAEAWNFGPMLDDAKPVKWIVEQLSRQWPDSRWEVDTLQTWHEAHLLKVDSTKAREQLAWRTHYALTDVLTRIVAWHRAYLSGADMRHYCLEQLEDYLLVQTTAHEDY